MASTAPPSYEDLEKQCQENASPRPLGSLDFLRLRWKMQDPISQSIQVVDDATDPESAQRPYFTEDGEEAAHPVSESSVFDQPVSSVDATVYWFNDWDLKWEMFHENHCGEEDHIAEEVEDPDDEDAPHRVVRCCGEERPPDEAQAPTMTVKASTKPFVTVHDYVTTIHPWLLSIKDQIAQAEVAHDPVDYELERERWVLPLDPKNIMLEERDPSQGGYMTCIRLAQRIVQRQSE